MVINKKITTSLVLILIIGSAISLFYFTSFDFKDFPFFKPSKTEQVCNQKPDCIETVKTVLNEYSGEPLVANKEDGGWIVDVKLDNPIELSKNRKATIIKVFINKKDEITIEKLIVNTK